MDIKNIIKIHHKCFHSVENGLYSLVDPVALRSAPKGSTISFWAKISNINEFPTAQHIYVPNILYSDGTQSTLVEIEKIDQWQFFSIDVDPDKTPISMQMYWYNGVWLEIGNVFIHGEKQAFNVENAIDYSSSNYKSVACPAEKTNGQTISNIIKLRAPGYYLGTINGIETYKSIVDPSILMNGGDCIKLSYMARVDSLNDDWMQQLTESERNSRVYVLRFRYSDGTVDYGAKTSLLYMNGIRLSKIINDIKTEYLYDGTQLIREKTGDDTIWYLYDDVGIVGITVNGATYYYVRNYQGDVTKLLDVTGCVVVEYIYDSWGKVIETTGSLADTVGEKNPIRYRGYYYDTDTELYYLNSRYYDAETGRFISPDVQAEDGNLYTYCQDDPVNRSDESGYLSKFWKRIIKIAIGVVATVAAVAITVASGGAALPVVASVVASTVVGGGIRAANSAIQGGSRDDILEAGIDGMCDGLMWGGLFVLGGSIVKAYASGNGLIKTVDPSYKPTNSFVSHGSTGRNMPQNLSEQLALKEAKSMPIQKWKILDKIEMGDARWLAKDGWVKVQYSAGKYGHIKIHATYNVYLDVFDDFKFIK